MLILQGKHRLDNLDLNLSADIILFDTMDERRRRLHSRCATDVCSTELRSAFNEVLPCG